jgi:hypothetical protein
MTAHFVINHFQPTRYSSSIFGFILERSRLNAQSVLSGAHTIRQFTTRQHDNSPTLLFANITIHQFTIRQHDISPT